MQKIYIKPRIATTPVILDKKLGHTCSISIVTVILRVHEIPDFSGATLHRHLKRGTHGLFSSCTISGALYRVQTTAEAPPTVSRVCGYWTMPTGPSIVRGEYTYEYAYVTGELVAGEFCDSNRVTSVSRRSTRSLDFLMTRCSFFLSFFLFFFFFFFSLLSPFYN